MPHKVSLASRLLVSAAALLFYVLNEIKDAVLPFYRLLMASKKPAVVRTCDSRFARLHEVGYPFKSNYLELADLPRVHYVDEGGREMDTITVLLLHGEPSWSFLYRNMIPPLVNAGYRVVAPDFIGFGKMHTRTLRLLIDQLRLDNIVMVCHDWGGLVGLSVLKQMPERFASLVLLNTALPTGEDVRESLFRSPLNTITSGLTFLLWRSFVALWGTNLPIRFIFRFMIGYPPHVVTAYTAPFPSSDYKAGPATWPLLVPLLVDDPVAPYMREARNFLKTWKKPTLVMFGSEDEITRGADHMFAKLIPHARVVPIAEGGHFIPESHPEILVHNVIGFIKKAK